MDFKNLILWFGGLFNPVQLYATLTCNLSTANGLPETLVRTNRTKRFKDFKKSSEVEGNI